MYMMARELKLLGVNQAIAIPEDSELNRRIDFIPKITLPANSFIRKYFTGKIEKYARERKISIIHSHDSAAHTIGLRVKKSIPEAKLIVTRRVIFLPSGWLSQKFKYSTKVDAFIAVSRAVELGLIESGIDKHRIEIINSSLDISEIKSNNEYWELPDRISEKCNKLIVTAGALTEEKDFFTAIKSISEAGKKFPGIGLLILGEGPQRLKLEKFIAESKLDNIFLMGHIEPMAPVFKKCELFLITSRSEGLNNSAIEASACGLPIVASNVGGLPEIVANNDNGLLCDAGDYKEFSKAVVTILSDEDMKLRMGQKSLEISDRFNIAENVQKISDLYKRMLAENI